MKSGKTLFIMMLFGVLSSFNVNADFFGGNDCPPWEYDCNDWPEWTPMYWMEEMSDEWDNNDDDYYRYGGMGPYGMPGGYGMPYGGMPYGGMPYGGGMMPPPAPYGYGAPPPAPYGYGAPQAPYGYGAPQGGQPSGQPQQ